DDTAEQDAHDAAPAAARPHPSPSPPPTPAPSASGAPAPAAPPDPTPTPSGPAPPSPTRPEPPAARPDPSPTPTVTPTPEPPAAPTPTPAPEAPPVPSPPVPVGPPAPPPLPALRAADDDAVTDEDVAVVAPVLTNAALGAGGSLAGVTVTAGAVGAAILGDDVVVTPAADWWGTAQVRYELCDAHRCDEAALTVDVAPVPDPPTAGPVGVTTDEDTPVTIDLGGVIGDPDGDLDL